jgi:capsular polysaccharide biosynthesis protein
MHAESPIEAVIGKYPFIVMKKPDLYNIDNLERIQDIVGNDLSDTSNEWRRHEARSFEELTHLGTDGHLKVIQSGTIPWDDGTLCNIDPWHLYSHWWGKESAFPELNIFSIQDALVYPGNRFNIDGNLHFISEVRDSSNRLVPEGMSRMEYGYCVRKEKADQIRQKAIVIKGTYLYLGRIIHHYGHFIVESLNKTWPVLKFDIDFNKVIPMLDPGGPGITAGVLSRNEPYIAGSFQRLGIPLKKARFIYQPMIVERLLVPTPSVRIHEPCEYVHPIQKEVWSMLNRENAGHGNRKIYLSRRKFKVREGKRRPLENEKEVEKLFAVHGFEIVNPEKTSFRKQLGLYGSATSLGGLAGSNVLNCAFMPDGGQVITIRPLSSAMTPRLEHTIGLIKKLKMIYYYANSPDIAFDSTESWSVDLKDLEAFLNRIGKNEKQEGHF